MALLFDAITKVRNFFYNQHLFKSYQSPLKTIGVGNLQVGGSGKTPFTAWLSSQLKDEFKIGILSRGYGRKTKGLIHANQLSNALTIGDEPFWYLKHLPDVEVLVAEQRKLGLQYYENTNVQLVLLDDAFQHRAVQLDVQIVLTEYSHLYIDDYLLPFGRLRESKKGIGRADIIVVTKCPRGLGLEEKMQVVKKLNPGKHQQIFFTSVRYQNIRSIKGKKHLTEINAKNVIALSSIAKPELFIEELKTQFLKVLPKSYRDHYNYSEKDIEQIVNSLDDETIVIMTEKDESKLLNETLLNKLPENKFWVLPIQIEVLFDEDELLLNAIKEKFKARE